MNSKQRVHAALRREPVDRVPIFMWFHPETAVRLARYLDIPPPCLPEAMGDDVRQAWVGNNYAMEGITHEHDGEGHTDAWGVEWVKEGPFNQIRHAPLQDADQAAVLAYRFPHEHIAELLTTMEPLMPVTEDTFIGCDVSPCLFEMTCRLRGMEDAILALAAEAEPASGLLERACAFSVELAQAACRRFPLDWLWTGDDVGSQQAMIMSPACWRERIGPRLARVVEVGTAQGLWTAYHSCGAIRPIIPDLIAMGVQVLNPVQCGCPGMDPLELKREFGRDLAFMGGVDTQELLPNGTVDQVRRETERLLAGMTAGGGYILAASHTVPPETPLENIFAMYEAAGVSLERILDAAADIRRRTCEHGGDRRLQSCVNTAGDRPIWLSPRPLQRTPSRER